MTDRPLTIQEQRLQRMATDYFDKAVNADSPVLAARYERLGNHYDSELRALRSQE